MRTMDKNIMKDIIVRKAKHKDIEGIIKIAATVGGNTKNHRQGFLMDDYTKDVQEHRKNIAANIENLDYFYVAANQEVVGFLMGYTREQWLSLHPDWVDDIYWHRNFDKDKLNSFILIDKTAICANLTGLGIGSRIYSTLFDDMRARNIHDIFAETLIAPTPNFASLEFRLKQEYQLCGFRYEQHRGNTLSTLVYHKEI